VGEDRTPTLLVLESPEVSRKLLRGMLRGEGYRILKAATVREALGLLKREKIDLIVLDLARPEASGLDFCRVVKTNRGTRFIPIVIITNIRGEATELAGIAFGADEFLVKPLQPVIVRARMRAMLRHKRAVDSLEDTESILFALARAVEYRDGTTYGHCDRLATLSVALGSVLGLPRPQLLALHRGGYLHDIGKIGVPDSILFKPGPLTEEQWAVMRTHSVKGEDICRPAKTLASVLPIIRSHHERWDGSGYPDGLRGEEIPLLARVLQVADIFDALTSSRPYKAAQTPAQALATVREEGRRGWRDAKVLEAFENLCATPANQGLAVSSWTFPTAVERSLDNMRNALATPSPVPD
jgi:putative two-component system response regulator